MSFLPAKDLTRVGRDNDGGYLVSMADVKATEYLVGLGVRDDWSFEEEFTQLNDVPVDCYDASVSERFFHKQIVKGVIRLYNPRHARHWIKALRSYKRFFTGKRRHIRKFVGLDDGETHVSLARVLAEADGKTVFIKADIEGSEYRILEDLIAHQDWVTGLVIEFHDCDIHLDKIEGFIDRFPLPVVHIHANNNAPLAFQSRFPTVIEITFSRFGETEARFPFPNALDMPCNPNKPEVTIRAFEDFC